MIFRPDPKESVGRTKKVKTIKRTALNKKRQPTGEYALFKEIWQTRPHVSFLSGREIRTPYPNNFCHVLAKAKNKYPNFKLFDKNLILLTETEHFLYDNGTMDSRAKYVIECQLDGYICDWSKIWDLRDELKKEYECL